MKTYNEWATYPYNGRTKQTKTFSSRRLGTIHVSEAKQNWVVEREREDYIYSVYCPSSSLTLYQVFDRSPRDRYPHAKFRRYSSCESSFFVNKSGYWFLFLIHYSTYHNYFVALYPITFYVNSINVYMIVRNLCRAEMVRIKIWSAFDVNVEWKVMYNVKKKASKYVIGMFIFNIIGGMHYASESCIYDFPAVGYRSLTSVMPDSNNVTMSNDCVLWNANTITTISRKNWIYLDSGFVPPFVCPECIKHAIFTGLENEILKDFIFFYIWNYIAIKLLLWSNVVLVNQLTSRITRSNTHSCPNLYIHSHVEISTSNIM